MKSLLKQKSRILWLDKRDQCSKFLFNTVTSRNNKNKITYVVREDGTIVSDEKIIKEDFSSFFENFLSKKKDVVVKICTIKDSIRYKLSEQNISDMDRDFSMEEIKETFFSLKDNKSPWSL